MNRKNPSGDQLIEIAFSPSNNNTIYFLSHCSSLFLLLQTMHKEKVKSTQNANKANNKEHKLNGSTKENSDKTGQ